MFELYILILAFQSITGCLREGLHTVDLMSSAVLRCQVLVTGFVACSFISFIDITVVFIAPIFTCVTAYLMYLCLPNSLLTAFFLSVSLCFFSAFYFWHYITLLALCDLTTMVELTAYCTLFVYNGVDVHMYNPCILEYVSPTHPTQLHIYTYYLYVGMPSTTLYKRLYWPLL